ncbi:hypothetical protein NQ176_g8432 [Zarea fungicola]|uniref:Uncharacterized protein n=1 Tax=Zarea fungicola TaxID=93591 RepID=A0ACC1MUH1_9HYPO|nr:hypothetical protein NQ176_g8432 [Lecanicillium fungicola]
MAFNRLVRFVPRGDKSAVLLGEPLDAELDVGIAVRNGDEVKVRVFSGSSALSAGSPTDSVESIDRILSPLTMEEVGTIRCIGLNYVQHAVETNLALPTVPILFIEESPSLLTRHFLSVQNHRKPATSLADPWPAPTLIPAFTVADNTVDYESELCVVLGKEAKNVSEEDALSYVLGYTASNDVSSRKSQFDQSQWCFSKGFDKACPIGPTLVSPSAIPDPSKLRMRGLKNGTVMQDTPLDDLIFAVPKLISFLSQGTTLPAGTIILTGTPAGIGMASKPDGYLKDGDEFSVEILPHIGTLVSKIQYEV